MSSEVIVLNKDFKAHLPIDFFKVLDEEQRIIEGYATTETVDREGEVVTRKAIQEALEEYKAFPTIRYMHERRPIGRAIDMKLDHRGLYVKAKIFKGPKDSEEAWSLIKQGGLMAFSIGGRVLEARSVFDKTLNRHIRKITKMQLLEISLVDIPANPETLIQVLRKSLGGIETQEDIQKDACRDEYINPDGTFKNGFKGCVEYFMTCKGLSEDKAKRMCVCIGCKAGKIRGPECRDCKDIVPVDTKTLDIEEYKDIELPALQPEVEEILVNYVKALEKHSDGENMSETNKQEETPCEKETKSLRAEIEQLTERLAKIEKAIEGLTKTEEPSEPEKSEKTGEPKENELAEIVKKTVEEELKRLKVPFRKALKEEATDAGKEKPHDEGPLKTFLYKRYGVEE